MAVTMTVTEQEWRLIMRSLAFFAGVKVTHKPEDQQQAAALNEYLLKQRHEREGQHSTWMEEQDEQVSTERRGFKPDQGYK